MENKQIEKLLDCSKCELKECVGCEITYMDRMRIREYIETIDKNINNLYKEMLENGSMYWAGRVKELLEKK